MAIGTALAVAGAVSSIGGSVAKGIAAKKRSKAAKQQQELAVDASKMTPRELKEFETQIRTSEQTINRERKLIEAVDPALIEAGKQAFQLLQGKEAAVLGPLRRDRDRKRQVLEETLRRRLGPGFETSSAGIEALTKFDTDTSDLLAQSQQSAALNLLQATQQSAQLARAGEQAGLAARRGAVGILQEARSREVAAITGTSQGVTQTAGGFADAVGEGLGGVGSFLSFGGQNISQGRGFFGASGGGGGGRVEFGSPDVAVVDDGGSFTQVASTSPGQTFSRGRNVGTR